MSKTIDQRVVEMRFDNRQFESGVATTMSTLDKFKEKLKFTDASKGLENISTAAKKVDLTPIGDSTEAVKIKFGALERYWDQTSRRIIDSVNMTAKKFVSAFTIDPIKTGFSEYETQINAIQTILANTESKGTTLDDVNGALDELNKYADKTIYNFTEMTRNIGTFTAAGVELDTSVSAIKGIANLAAVSGSTSQQASTAMYQLSQAMASGTVKLMDWNSVVNAGMGGQVFQDALKETAKVHGVAIDDIIARQGSFRESLSEGWLTTEILTDTLAKFTGDLTEEQLKAQGYTEQQIKDIMKLGQTANDAATKVKTFTQLFDTLKEAAQSGWTQTWEILVGDFEEAKALLTSISDTIGGIIGKSADARNELLENWKVLGGRQDIIDSFKNIWDAIVNIVTPIKEAFQDIFPPMTSERLKAITEGIKEFTSKLVLSDKGMDNLKRTFKGIFAVAKVFVTILKAVFKAVSVLFDGVSFLGGGILGVTAVIGDLLVALAHIITSGNVFERVFTAIAKVLNFVIKVVAFLVKGFAELMEFAAHGLIFPGIDFLIQSFRKIFGGMNDVGDSAVSMKDRVGDAFQAMGDAIKKSPVYKFFATIINGVKTALSSVGKAIGNIFGSLFERIRNADIMGIIEIVNGIISGGIGLAIIDFLRGLKDGITGFDDILDNINDILGSVGGAFKAFQNAMNAEALKKIAIAIAILAASLLVLSFINKEKLTNSLSAIVVMFGGLMGTLAVLNKSGEISKGAMTLVGMATAILIMSFALRALKKLDIAEIGKGLVGIGSMVAILVGAMILLSQNSKNVVKGGLVMIALATAVRTMVPVIQTLGSIPSDQLKQGATALAGVVALVAALGLVSTYTKPGTIMSMAQNLLAIGAALLLLAGACKLFGLMNWEELKKGGAVLGSITGVLLILGAISKFGHGGHMAAAAASIIILATAIQMLVPVLLVLTRIDPDELTKAGAVLGALTLALVALGGVSRYTKPGTLNAMSASLIVLGIALNTLLPSIIILSAIPVDKLIQAGIALAGIVTALALLGAVSRIADPVTIMALSMSLGVLAINLLILAVPLAIFSALGDGAFVGLVVLAGALVGLAVVAKLFRPLIPTMFALASSIALIGAGSIALGIGLTILGAALASVLAGLGAGLAALGAGILAFVLTVGTALVAAGEFLVDFFVQAGDAVLRGIVILSESLSLALTSLVLVLCQVLIESVPAIVDALLVLVLRLCESLAKHGPTIVVYICEFLVGLLAGLVEFAPPLIDLLFDLLIVIIEGLADRIPDLAVAIAELFMSIFRGAFEALGAIDTTALLEGTAAMGLIVGIIAGLGAIAGMIPAAMLGAVGATAVMGELALLVSAFGVLFGNDFTVDLLEKGGRALEALGNALGKLFGGFIGGLVEGTTSSMPQIGDDMSKFMDKLKPFIEGAKSIDGSVVSGVKSLVEVMKMISKASLSEGVAVVFNGRSSLDMFCEDLPKLGDSIAKFSKSLGTDGINVDAVKSATEALRSLAQMADLIPNEGGWIAKITGDNTISAFGNKLPALANGLMEFSNILSGIGKNGSKVTPVNIEAISAATTVLTELAEMASVIPNEGGWLDKITGSSSIAGFGGQLEDLGKGIAKFSGSLGKDGINLTNVQAAVQVAKDLAEMSNYVPKEDGLFAWFSGKSGMASFVDNMEPLGTGLASFATSTNGITYESVSGAVDAAVALAEMTDHIPKEGGMMAWLSGESGMASFASNLKPLGDGIYEFATSTAGITSESIAGAVDAAVALAEMTDHIPNEGGIRGWFSGESGMLNFASNLGPVGDGIKAFATATNGITSDSVSGAANAAKTLAEMCDYIPNEGGLAAWFSGESGVAKFARELPIIGDAIKGFAASLGEGGIDAVSVTAAAGAAEALAKMTEHIPKAEGIKQWFTGDTNVADFADKLPKLGEGLRGFSDSLGSDFNATNTEAAATAAESLAKMTETVPRNSDKIIKFGSNLSAFGTKLTEYFRTTRSISPETVAASNNALGSIEKIANIDTSKIKSVSEAIIEVVKAIKNLSKVPKDSASSFTKALKELGESSADSFLKEFKDLDTGMKKAGKAAIDALIDGIESKTDAVKKAGEKIAQKAADAISGKKKAFRQAGKDLADGLAEGIEGKRAGLLAKITALANSLAAACRNALNINSPSRVFRDIGYGIPEGLAIGIDKLSGLATDSAVAMADSSVEGVKSSISRIADVINGDIDTQPTIRPVLDLSDVKAGARSIGGLFGSGVSIGANSNINAIASVMARRNQNGTNSDVVSAINKLSKSMDGAKGDTYNFGNWSFNEDSNVEAAVKELVRAVTIGRRV